MEYIKTVVTDFKRKAKGPSLVLARNIKEGLHEHGKKYFYYVCPSRHEYHDQYFWDSCFHAIAMADFSPELARNELRSLLSTQQPNGFIPHMIFWRNLDWFEELVGANLSIVYDRIRAFLIKILFKTGDHSDLIQPPVIALAVYELYKKIGDDKLLREIVPKLNRYYSYLRNERDFDNTKLISIIHPYESGMDSLPVFDIPLFKGKQLGMWHRLFNYYMLIVRYDRTNWNLNKIRKMNRFVVKNLLVNCSYVFNLRILAWLNRKIGYGNNAKKFEKWAQETENAIIRQCYDKKDRVFYPLYSKENRMIKMLSIDSLFPLMLNIDKKMQQEIISHLTNSAEFWTRYPVPSIPKSNPNFNPRHTTAMIWHTGESWPPTNWLIYIALKRKGYAALAEQLKQRNLELTRKTGFNEYFHPETGKGFGAKNQGWTTIFYANESITKQKDI